MRFLSDFQLTNKRVLIRSDFNVPLSPRGKIADDFRIRAAVPTIQYAQEQGAKVILMSHLDRPGGKRVDRLSLKGVAKVLSGLLGARVGFVPNCVGKTVEDKVKRMKSGQVFLLENLRFHEGEEENDQRFAELLARHGDLYVNDAFSASHRAHASIVGVPAILPGCAGLELKRELEILARVKEDPTRPFVVVIGGAKVATKGKFLRKMKEKADVILVGNLLARAIREESGSEIPPAGIIFAPDGIPGKGKEYDIGPKTRELFLEKIQKAGTVLWTGPLGKIEDEKYVHGSLAVAEGIWRSGAFSVVGGGDVAGFLGKHGLRERMNHVSTGGGAMLAYVAGEELPGLKALENYDKKN